ncbi:MAG: DMT family transporter [Lachnospiraceae bacterium]|nr:DMT family transporter [Lachnospiraceae bacterium]
MKLLVGLCAGIFWALDTVILNLCLGGGTYGLPQSFAVFLPLVVTCLHDLCSAAYLLLFQGGKKRLAGVRAALFTREGRFVMLGALLGGPVGMAGYVSAVRYLGAANTAMISALFPAVGSVMAFLFLKERLSAGQTTGLLLSVAGMALMGGKMAGTENGALLPGVCCALLCVFGWAGEVVICSYGMKSGVLDNEQALTIRQITSALFYFCIILSIIRGHAAAFRMMASSGMPLIAAAALAGTVSYLCYYLTIRRLGASVAMALNVTYAAWAIVLEGLLLHEARSLRECVCGVIIVGGALLSALLAGKAGY